MGGGGGHRARWRAWWRLGEREGSWRVLGVVDGYWRRGERRARRGLWGEEEVDVGRRWRAWRRRGEREQWWRGLEVGVVYSRRGEGEVDVGHTVLQRFTGLQVPNNLQQVNRALKVSLQGREVPLTHMAICSCVLNMLSALAGLGSPGGTGVMYSKVHPLSTSTNILSPVQDDSHAYCVFSAVLNDDDVIYDEENTVSSSALEDLTASSDRTPHFS